MDDLKYRVVSYFTPEELILFLELDIETLCDYLEEVIEDEREALIAEMDIDG